MLDTSIRVKTDTFDGPLALLLLLVQKEEMDIRDLNLTKITKEYLDYLTKMKLLNFDLAGDYLYLAATLLFLKSKSAINESDINLMGEEFQSALEITSQAELVRRLEELKHFQKLSFNLWSLPKKGHQVFVKPKVNKKAIIDSILTPIDLEQLTNAMVEFIKKSKRKYKVVRKDRLSIKEKLITLKEHLKQGDRLTFEEIMQFGDDERDDDVINLVITFVSILELVRLQKMSVFQNLENGEIYIEIKDSLENFDVEQADGFEDQEEESKKSIDDSPNVKEEGMLIQ